MRKRCADITLKTKNIINKYNFHEKNNLNTFSYSDFNVFM